MPFILFNFLSVVLISLLSPQWFLSNIKNTSSFPLFRGRRGRISPILPCLQESSVHVAYLNDVLVEIKASFIQGCVAHPSRNSGFLLHRPKKCTSVCPFLVFTGKFLKVLVADNLLDLPINKVSIYWGGILRPLFLVPSSCAPTKV